MTNVNILLRMIISDEFFEQMSSILRKAFYINGKTETNQLNQENTFTRVLSWIGEQV